MQSDMATVTIRIDAELKDEAQALFEALGLDLSTATGIFYRQALRCNGLPFEVKLEEPNETTYKAIACAEKNEDCSRAFDSVDELMEALDA